MSDDIKCDDCGIEPDAPTRGNIDPDDLIRNAQDQGLQCNGFEYYGRWIESYPHTFGDRQIDVWRVRTTKGGAILSKHLPTEEIAKQAAKGWNDRDE